MGSNSKKSKRGCSEIKKHSQRSRSRSPKYSSDAHIINNFNDGPGEQSSGSDGKSYHRNIGNRKYYDDYVNLSSRSRTKSKSPSGGKSGIKRSRSPSMGQSREKCSHRHHKHPRKHSNTVGNNSFDHSSGQDDYQNKEKGKEKGSNSGEYSPPVGGENGAGNCLSIEETNKLRAKLGLKPLEVDSQPTSSKKSKSSKAKEDDFPSYKDEWGEFVHKPAEHIGEKFEAEKLKEKLSKIKVKRFLENKLRKVKTLGESDDEYDDDIQRWIEKNKQKDFLLKEAQKRAQIIDEIDSNLNSNEREKRKASSRRYENRHLKGLRVDHDLKEFNEGRDIVLTLKDKGVLEDSEDTLINVNLLDEERYRTNVEHKKQRYNSYDYNMDMEEVCEIDALPEKKILGKYDEKEKRGFRIGEDSERSSHLRELAQIKAKLAGKRLETLNETLIKPATDTFSEVELERFKKPKRKMKKLRQKLNVNASLSTSIKGDYFGNQYMTGEQSHRKRSMTDDTATVQDSFKLETEIKEEEDAQKVLSKAKKLKQKPTISTAASLCIGPDEFKMEIKSESESDDETTGHDVNKDGNIIFNATAEFCRTLGDIPTYGMAGNRDEGFTDMYFEVEQQDQEREKEEIPNITSAWNAVNPEIVIPHLSEDNTSDVPEIPILDEEPDVGAGVAAALRLALSKGYLEKEEKKRPSNTKMIHLQAKNYSIEDKAYGDEDKFGKRDRYYSGPLMEFKEKDNFKPNVKLDYIDDNGRILNAKEAFRYLSHKFHGKGPGKNKIEKRLKKMEQEGLMKKMSSTDTPLGTLNMLQQKQKETQAPYVVLSGGKPTQVSTSLSKHK